MILSGNMTFIGGLPVPADHCITSKDNPAVKLYLKLSSQKKERQRYGLFVLEGLRIVEDAVQSGNVEKLFFTEDNFIAFSGEHDLSDIMDRVFIISPEIAKKISLTETTQGVFAVCRIRDCAPVFTENGKYVVLYGLQDPGNVGTIIRTADALGIDGIFMCDSCDLYNPKTLRSTMGSVFRMPVMIINNDDELFSMLKENEVKTMAAVIDADAVKITDIRPEGKQAVFIGNEGNGLSRETADRCDTKVTIPMHGNINSLNAAMAAGILMWEISRDKN